MQPQMLESPLDRAAQFLLSHQSLDAFSPSTAMDMMFFEREKSGIKLEELSLDYSTNTNVLNLYGEIRHSDHFPLPNGSFVGVTPTVLASPAQMINDPRVNCTNNDNANSPPSSGCGWPDMTNLQQSFVTNGFDLLPDFAVGPIFSTERKLSQVPLSRTVSCPATVIQGNLSSSPGTSTPAPQVAADSLKKGKGYSNDVPSPPTNRKMEPSRRAIKEEVEELDEKVGNRTGGRKSSDYGDQEKPKSVPDIPKPDYIHVRARRGQATDSHSLAERVRREKISERMRLLQDLVPGCNKITGKAGMLDEIINYVQSLQRQVEFLSMKLAAVNRRSEENAEGFLDKEIFSPSAYHHLNLMPYAGTAVQPPQLAAAPGSCSTELPIYINNNHTANNNNLTIHNHNINNNIPSGMTLRRTTSAPVAVTDDFLQSCFQDNRMPSVTPGWDFDLPNLYTMDFPQARQSLASPDQTFSGNGEMHNLKMELIQ